MLSAEALSFRQQSRLAISLSWIGGFTNVFAFLTWHNFASHMTGASTLVAYNTTSGHWGDALLFASLVAAFLAGAVSSAFMTEIARRRGTASKYTLPLTLEALLLAILLWSLGGYSAANPAPLSAPLMSLTAFAMGLQNATITKISGAVVRSTHLTGVLTDLGIESVQFALWAFDQLRGRAWQRAGRILRVSQRHPSSLRVLLLASIWCSFVFGASICVLTYGRFQQFNLIGPIAFLLFIIAVDWRTPIADIRELDVLADPELKIHGIVHTMLPPQLGLYRVTHTHQRFRSPNFSLWVDRLPENKRVIILALSPRLAFDTNALLHLQSALDKIESSHRRLILAGITPVQYKKLAHQHLTDRIGPSYICPDIEFAIALGNDLVHNFHENHYHVHAPQ
jgi:uncharacterized membrane protein YoaK (UPF0700 family)